MCSSDLYAGFVVFFSIAVFIMSLMMHELGHTMIAISRGVCVSEIGIGIKEGIFLAYTKMLQLEKLEKKKDKICICFGGILMNVFLLSVALIINGLWWESIILKIVICVNLLVTLFNFSIYFHVLSEVLRFPDRSACTDARSEEHTSELQSR